MRKSEGRKAGREEGNRADDARAGRAEDDADRLPELSEQGGIAPTERNPGRYNDRTRDRTLDES